MMPVPEPEFAAFGKYHQGVDVEKIDRRVEKICVENQTPYTKRWEFKTFEKDDTLFRDEVHFHVTGRKLFSEWMAKRVVKIENI